MLSFQEFWTVEFFLLKTPYPRAWKAGQAWDPLLRVTFFNAKIKHIGLQKRPLMLKPNVILLKIF